MNYKSLVNRNRNKFKITKKLNFVLKVKFINKKLLNKFKSELIRSMLILKKNRYK